MLPEKRELPAHRRRERGPLQPDDERAEPRHGQRAVQGRRVRAAGLDGQGPRGRDVLLLRMFFGPDYGDNSLNAKFLQSPFWQFFHFLTPKHA